MRVPATFLLAFFGTSTLRIKNTGHIGSELNRTPLPMNRVNGFGMGKDGSDWITDRDFWIGQVQSVTSQNWRNLGTRWSKAHLLRDRRLVFSAQVSVGLHRQDSTVFVPEPAGDGRSRFRSQESRKLPRYNICVGKAAQERKMTGNSCFRSNPDQTANKKGERP
jgi:hypothetical protein